MTENSSIISKKVKTAIIVKKSVFTDARYIDF